MKITARILNNPALRCDDSGKRFVLCEEMRYEVAVGKETVMRGAVPAGSSTDFASIPDMANWLVPKLGKYNLPAVLHDHFYKTGLVGKDLADRIFLAAMKAAGVKWWRRELMFVAVRYGGWPAWWAHRKADKETT